MINFYNGSKGYSQNTIRTVDVRELRKKGKIFEALDMLQPAFENRELFNDIWVLRETGWVLIALVKWCRDNNDPRAQMFYSELKSLKFTPDETIILKKIKELDANPLCIEATRLSKEGNLDAAEQLYWQAVAQGDTSENTAVSLGWVCFKKAKAQYDAKNYGQCKEIITRYMNLNDPPVSVAHSRMLWISYSLWLSQKVTFHIFEFIEWWNLNKLTQEDWQDSKLDDGTVFEAIAKRAIKAAAKEISQLTKQQCSPKLYEAIEAFLPWLDKVPATADSPWTDWWKAKILLLLGRAQEAKDTVLSVVKVKNSEAWAWSHLGKIMLELGDNAMALSCFAKGTLCKGPEDMKSDMRAVFAKVLAQSGNTAQAKVQLDKYLKHKEATGEKAPQEYKDLTCENWYTEAIACDEDEDFLKSLSSQADSLLFGDIPFVDGMAGRIFEKHFEDKSRKKYRNIYFKDSKGRIARISVNQNMLPKNITDGTALSLRIKEDQGRFKVISCDIKADTPNWYLCESKTAVVNHVDKEKEIAIVSISWDDESSIPLKEIREKDIRLLDVLKIQSITFLRNGEYKTEVVEAHRTDENAPPSLIVNFTGTFEKREDKTFGFVKAKDLPQIFVPPYLVKLAKLEDSSHQDVKGTAIYKKNPKKLNKSLNALKLFSC